MVSGTEENKEYYFKTHKNADEKYEGDDPNVVLAKPMSWFAREKSGSCQDKNMIRTSLSFQIVENEGLSKIGASLS